MSRPDLTDTWLWKYREAIRTKEIIAGRELITELDRLIDDFTNPRYYYDTTVANERMDCMENCIKLTKSPFYGKPMILMLWQKAFIEVLFSFHMSDTGLRRFKRVVLLIARKNTKSETCSAISLTELLLGLEGEDIVCASNDDRQAGILYEAINTMRLLIDPKQVDTWKNQQGIKCLYNNSKIVKFSDKIQNKEGFNIDTAIIDEAHEKEDNSSVKPIEQSQSLKPNPLLIIISTEGFVVDGFLDDELKICRSIINGENDSLVAERILPWLYTQDNEREIWEGNRENRLWMKSNPTLGIVKRWEYLEEQVDKARGSKTDRAFVLSKDFNWKVGNAESWLMSETYEYDATYDIEDLRGCVAIAGDDLASTTDMCAAKLLIMRPNDKRKYIISMYWIPQSKLESSDDFNAGARYKEWARRGLMRIVEGNEVDGSVVADWHAEMYKTYGIRILNTGYDVRLSKDFVKRMDDYGFETTMIPQNRWTLTSPMRLIEKDFKQQLIVYNNNEIDRWCLRNTSIQLWDTGHFMPIKIKGQASHRIDGSLALIIAYETFRQNKTEFMGCVR